MLKETTRLSIRPFKLEDINDAYISWLNDKIATQYSNQRFIFHTKESCVKYQESFENTHNSFLLITSKSNNEAIGTMTIYRRPEHGTADIGILIGNRNYWGKGLGLEAWNAVLTELLAVEKIRKVTAGTARVNKAMISIMEKSGMMQEAIRYRQEIIGESEIDILYYAKFSEGLAR